jgi:mono/diheme cytochrome c family protein
MSGRRATKMLLLVAVLAACDRLPGRPRPDERPLRPSQVLDFAALYGRNCAGCHGDDERPGASLRLADPVYLALADDETLRRIAAHGVPDTGMPGFARAAGGELTDEQIDAIVRGLRERWGRPDAARGIPLPPYEAPPGDPQQGALAYAARCAICHGPAGRGTSRGGSVADATYLELVSDQHLRTAVLVGRPALGMPDWRGANGAQPMSAEEIADVVAWLIDQRVERSDG